MSRRRPAPLFEVALLAGVLLVFSWAHGAVAHSRAVATANARRLQSIEGFLHLDIEPAANRWLVAHPAFIQPAVYVYRLYYLVPLGVLLWAYLRHTSTYRRVRNTLLAMLILVLPVYWAVPMSPPRFAIPGVVDIIAEHDLFGSTAFRDQGAGQNFTAMPSMHVGWAAWCAYAVWTTLRPTHPRLSLLAWLFPLLMTAVVFTTGNHYVLDVVGTGLLLTAAVIVGHLVSRLTD
ncbi:phosphatase PAP2 family protein [Catenuloplanes japonicus]|uniref:phosphatase PAP2 family protein n=1 Tax=Catenuloplanes japonicus TaxID=33876 RepID=UPI000523FD0E|nr:phosphatase PAP2 family protein [Catenuloplanes japonicus]